MKFKILLLLVGVILPGFSGLQAQFDTVTLSGLHVIRNPATLSGEIKADSTLEMVDLGREIPSLVMDLRYATPRNFLHRSLYPPLTTTFLRKPAAEALKKVEDGLLPFHLGLKIFDAYRPWSVTVEMWQAVPDDRYAANPSGGSGHNRGIAVDLTLIDLITTQELPMGTGFDSFSDTAHRDFTGLPAQVLANRLFLLTIMEQQGFVGLKTEWWHFSLPHPQNYEVLDIPFHVLATLP